MAKISKDTAADVMAVDGYEGRMQDLGGYTVAFESFTANQDPAPLFRGLPDDRCQCPHWGVVVKGELVYRYADGTEDRIREGEAYYARPGHLPVMKADTETIEFSPSDGLAETIAVVTKNVEGMQAAQS
jgi:hypothetical protein